MLKFAAILISLMILPVCAWSQGSDKADKSKLTRVVFDETAQPKPAPTARQDPDAYPRPGDQMYVFYYVGRLLSLPVDFGESLVRRVRDNFRKEGEPTPAAADAFTRPFDRIERSEIPPAPPVQR